MIYERIGLDDSDENVFLEAYVPDKTHNFVRDGLLVIPGGGYGCVCSDREGEPIALEFVQKGCAAFVLHYSVGEKALFPRPLIEASKAMKYIKDNSMRYGIDSERVFVTGFSAGGHLCASLGILWHMKEIYDAVPMEYGYNKPKGIMPIYPVVSDMVPTHADSFNNILGKDNPSEEEKKKYSLELSVDEKSAPAFIVHTSEDSLVPVFNALALAKAYADKNMSFELHIYKTGAHGMALSNEITSAGEDTLNNKINSTWTYFAREWMKSIK